MSDISAASQAHNPALQQHLAEQARTSDTGKTGDVLAKKDQQGQVDFLIVVWMAFFSSLATTQNTAQTHTHQLQATQDVELQTNKLLASYNYANISQSMMGSSWNPEFAAIQETNDRVQAQINITQNMAAIEQQTGQTQQTNANTSIQQASQAMQQGVGVAKLAGELVQTIAQI